MIIKKGQLLLINHERKGKFGAVALEDFDSEKAEWYPVATRVFVDGLSSDGKWTPGETIPCKRTRVSAISIE